MCTTPLFLTFRQVKNLDFYWLVVPGIKYASVLTFYGNLTAHLNLAKGQNFNLRLRFLKLVHEAIRPETWHAHLLPLHTRYLHCVWHKVT